MTLQNLSLDWKETTLQLYLPSPKPLVNLRRRGSLANDVSCANCGLFSKVVICAHSQKETFFRPTQASVRGWKARTSIRSFTDEASPTDDASLSPSLFSHLCYSCHTTLTSRSSRSTATPSWNSSDSQSEVQLPMWAAVKFTAGHGDEQDGGSPYTKEVWESKKLDANGVKSLVTGFLLE
jgi:hypothetical protein